MINTITMILSEHHFRSCNFNRNDYPYNRVCRWFLGSSLASQFELSRNQWALDIPFCRARYSLVWCLGEWYHSCVCTQEREASMQARTLKTNAHKLILVCYSEKRRCLPMWNRKSPPVSRSITRKRLSRSWKAKCIFAMKGCFSCESRTRSFITEFTDFLARTLILCVRYLALLISFIA